MTKQNRAKSIEDLLRGIGEVDYVEFLRDSVEMRQAFKDFVNSQKDGGCEMRMMFIENGELIPVEVNNENLEALMTGKFGEEKTPETINRGIVRLLEFLKSSLETSDEQDNTSVEDPDVEEFIRKLDEMYFEEPTECYSQKPHHQKVGAYGEGIVVNTLAIQKRSLQAFLRRMGMRLVYTDSGAYGEYTEETKRAVPFTRSMSVISFDKCVQFYNNRNALCAKPINPKKLYLTIRDKEVVANKHVLRFHRPDEGWAEIQSLVW